MSSGIMCGTCWGGCLGELHGWNVMYPCESTLVGCAGAASGFVSGVCTIRGGFTSGGGAALVNISVSCLSATICLSPNVVSGLVGVGLRREWVSSTAACVAAYCEDSLGKVSVAGENL